MTKNTKTEAENDVVKKRGQYTTKKKKELENLLTAAKEFRFTQKKEKTSLKNPASIAEFTKDTCLYPANYLDNDNTCVNCHIYEHCACNLKNLGKKKRNE
jgi:hypothetical protein